MTSSLGVLAIALATAWTATAQHPDISGAEGRRAPATDVFTTTAHAKPRGADPAKATKKTGTSSAADTTGNTGLTFTVVAPAHPSLTLAKRHHGTFTQGGDGVYTITAANSTAAGPTDGTRVTVHDLLPAGLRAERINGRGWHCIRTTLTCTRNDVLPAGHSYPVITLKVDVACNARPRVTNIATVTGGGDPTRHTATDPTRIDQYPHHSHLAPCVPHHN
ncbi:MULTISPECIES: hypothetical protein [unclassified Streptomyces]|uniref:hypothetical protein n=1 Tax=unclassified Streptomyces TaxID=2593676 RepID=UPI00342A6633